MWCLLISYWPLFQGTRYWCCSCHIFIFKYWRTVKCKSQWRINTQMSRNKYTDVECCATSECRRKEEKVSLWLLWFQSYDTFRVEEALKQGASLLNKISCEIVNIWDADINLIWKYSKQHVNLLYLSFLFISVYFLFSCII